MELRTIEQDRAEWRIADVRDRMVRHSKAITDAEDLRAPFLDRLLAKPEKTHHHIKMLWMLNHGLTMLRSA